jgi:hypothetical protein
MRYNKTTGLAVCPAGKKQSIDHESLFIDYNAYDERVNDGQLH